MAASKCIFMLVSLLLFSCASYRPNQHIPMLGNRFSWEGSHKCDRAVEIADCNKEPYVCVEYICQNVCFKAVKHVANPSACSALKPALMKCFFQLLTIDFSLSISALASSFEK